jgi:hypothetical protein
MDQVLNYLYAIVQLGSHFLKSKRKNCISLKTQSLVEIVRVN